ncbi:MAG: ABC transporter ATP-binding protein, partial [Polyangiales bacterium]
MSVSASTTSSWLRQVFTLVPDLRRTLWTGVMFTAAVECFKLVPPYLLKTVIDLLGRRAPLPDTLAAIGGILLISLITTAVEQRYSNFVSLRAFRIESDILRKAHARLLDLGLGYHEDHPSGDLVQLLGKGSSQLRELLWFSLDQFLGASLQLVLTAIVLTIVHPGCGLVFVAFLPVVLYQVHRSGQRLQPYRERYHAVFRQASWDLNQSLLNVRTVMDYVQEPRETRQLGDKLDRFLQLADERNKIESSAQQVRDWVLASARFAVLFYAVYLVYDGAMTTGSLFLFATLSEKVVSSLFRLGRLHSYLGDAVESVNQLARLVAEKPRIADRPQAKRCAALSGEITLSDVAFAYRPDRPVLEEIDLTIPARSVLAVVGRSGAGKTTLIKLLSRHYDVTGGSIQVDGVDIRDYALSDYRRQVAVVSQD